jgi:poly-gamma-glutamate synthesis protein (capsule biosynthesis protein)
MRLTRRELVATTLAPAGGCLGRLDGLDRSTSLDCPATVDGGRDARLGFVGDVMLGRSVDEQWSEAPPEGVWGSTVERLRSLDGLFANLECCVSDRGERRPGRTYYFRADPDWAIPALESADVTWAGLANNHVLDFGPTALADTVDHLSSAGIATAGAGEDREAATRPAVVDCDGVEIAVVAFTDQSSGYAAGRERPGTAYASLDPAQPLARRLVGRALERARALDSDLVVASLHWGPNWEVRPSETQRRFARWLVESGVDLVHGHSAHVLQGIEVHHGRPIIYDAGDFVDDYVVKEGLHNDRSALFELEIADGRVEALRIVPVRIRDRSVHEADGDVATWVRDRLRTLSEPFDAEFTQVKTGLRLP